MINNEGGVAQNSSAGSTEFKGKSTAASAQITMSGGLRPNASGGAMTFHDTATANKATITVNGAAVSGAGGGEVSFFDDSTVEASTITINGAGAMGAIGGLVTFQDRSNLNDFFTVNGSTSGGEGGRLVFADDSANGGAFNLARLKLSGNGSLDISPHNPPGVGIGTLQGDGDVFLGASDLSLAGTRRYLTFAGRIHDGGINGGTGGSVTMITGAQYILTGASTYTGGTNVLYGFLITDNTSGSATGTGPVQVGIVDGQGTLGGSGTISGNVNVGPTNVEAVIRPSVHKSDIVTLTIQGTVSFNARSSYEWNYAPAQRKGVTLVANGVTIDPTAKFVGVSFTAADKPALPVGTVFTAINNTSTSPISGTFSNLADGGVYLNFKANYEGGDGNDLTLTVIQ